MTTPINVAAVRRQRVAAQTLASRVSAAAERATQAFAAKADQPQLAYNYAGNAIGLVAPSAVTTIQVLDGSDDASDISMKAADGPLLVCDVNGYPVGIVEPGDVQEVTDLGSDADGPNADQIALPGGGLVAPPATPSLQASGKKKGCASCGKPHGDSFHSRPVRSRSVEAAAALLAKLSSEELDQLRGYVSHLTRF